MNNEESNNNANSSDNYPKVLYKYANWDNDYHKKLITTPEIYFASPGDFNDPYDSGVPARYDEWSGNDWRNFLCDNGYTAQEINYTITNSIGHDRSDPQSIFNEIERDQNLHFLQNVGILSLSETKESILMWSHYANSHKGFCIGYDTKRIEPYVREHYKLILQKNNLTLYIKIKYANQYPKIIPIPKPGDFSAYKKRLETKYADWQYEKEWRLTVNQNEQLYERVIKIPIDSIVEIYLGLRMPHTHIANIIFELRRLNYEGKLYKAEQDKYSYQLKFNEIKL